LKTFKVEIRAKQLINVFSLHFRMPSFSAVTNSNCVDLPACFYLKMNRPMPFSLSFIQRLGNATCTYLEVFNMLLQPDAHFG